MKRIVLAALVLACVASCKKPECPTCEKCPPPPPPCPEPSCDVKLDDGGAAPAWRLVQQDGKAFLMTTLPDKRVIAVPVTEATTIFVDGKQATGGEMLRPGGGSCPCQLPQCLPYCRPIGDVLSPPQP